ncbi:ELL-associated factor 1-like isoform X1 [Montipora capricornis]|uniref:ELL-associated factor 1-like isoform X3 n=1 Tax=Montipora foliosa TaxID=591990 RepID=UPI0035F1AD21
MAASRSDSEFPFNSDREYELRLGNSFHSRGGPKTAFHTIRYDFKPASVDTTRPAELVVGEKNEVTVTVPHVQDNSNTIYRGSKRSCTKEFILVVDKDKKTFTLERIESTIPQLKKVRSSRQAPKSVKLPVTPSTATLSKSQKSKTKKKTVDQKASKLDSPVKNTSTAAISPEETSIKPDDVGPVAAVSDSSLSSSSNSSDSEKDENEDGDEFDEKDVEKLNSLMTGQMDENDTLSKKEGFNTLCEDLQLSESGSDSD